MASTSPEGKALYQKFIIQDNRNIVHILEDLKTCKPPIDHLCELLPRLQCRYYSISSSPKVGFVKGFGPRKPLLAHCLRRPKRTDFRCRIRSWLPVTLCVGSPRQDPCHCGTRWVHHPDWAAQQGCMYDHAFPESSYCRQNPHRAYLRA